MRLAICKFNYENILITIINSAESLNIFESSKKSPYNTEVTGTPTTDIILNGVLEKNVTIDLGSNGYCIIEENIQ